MWKLPLTPADQTLITSKELARIVIDLLIRNDGMPQNERNWKVSYYPFSLEAIRAFEVVGYSHPEVPEFRRKWNEAVTILQANALVTRDPAQESETAMVPTSFATEPGLTTILGPASTNALVS